ncbi:hypothetical protein LC593_32895 [Nostoc sp. CHAB 5844]|nr:hypothetical protein [Nostoc sp. CHAB 5844]
MTNYCQSGNKAIVVYSFNGGKEKKYKSKVSPIEVNTFDGYTRNIPGEIYAWNFSTALNPQTTLEDMPFRAKGMLTNFQVTGLINTDTINGIEYGNWACSFVDGDANTITGSAVGYYPNDLPTLVKIQLSDTETICRLEAKDIDGNLLFSDNGKCPCNFTVQCGNCPDGFVECPHPGYPGYCCIDCKGSAAKINALAQTVEQYGRAM